MSSPGSPVGGKPSNPFEKYYELKAIRDETERGEKQPSKQNLTFTAYVLLLLQKFFSFLIKSQELSKSTQKQIKENLLQMKSTLTILKYEDKSQESPFLKNLSQTWQKMLENSLQFKKMTPLAIEFKNFIKEIASYPEGQDHSLAYYLSEYAGGAWLPFPYMELIQRLHILSEKNPSSNPLDEWIHSLEKIIVLLNQE